MATLILLRHGESQWNQENRFTGWVDVPLSPKGLEEARRAGDALKAAGLRVEIAYTSALRRAQETLRIVLEALGQPATPVIKDAALNERHYGQLQGLNKAETAKKFGDEQVRLWRRSYDIAPPGGESLKDTAARTLPYFHATIAPELTAGKTVLVAAHGNSLRSIVMDLEHLTKAQVLDLNLATGVPYLYDLDAALTILSKRQL
ncbi:MAG: 2,3-bisphosphoglycerate-dependent phosphoglycerate mutase [Candidatus Omnitrophica bacterium]|nr:2,3-bisphosphoglycerate-dependent phosphoglycerate mutase [Candidatus Omnitrophota bacterium]